jgi:8-amino-7-oxononanoate synthase
MNDSWKNYIEQSLSTLEQQQILRRRGGASKDPAGRLCDLDFGSNDYLGLRNSTSVMSAFRDDVMDGSSNLGWGSGASPVLSGYSADHRDLEKALSCLCSTENALVFSSGFACNTGTLAALADEDCIVFSDQLNHASLIDGQRLGRSTRVIYPHINVDGLHQLLIARRNEKARALIVTESVFSMDGDEAPLRQLVELAEQFDCGLICDEAHAVGVFGSRGGGLLEELELSDRVLLKLGTLSKSMGGIGGYAAGSNWIIEYLVNRCRSYIFSTAIPPLAARATLAAIFKLQEMQSERKKLLELSCYTRCLLAEQGWQITPGRSPIVPLILGDPETALGLSRGLGEHGIYVPAIRPPTVPASTCRLRISLSANHSRSDVIRLGETLSQIREKLAGSSR